MRKGVPGCAKRALFWLSVSVVGSAVLGVLLVACSSRVIESSSDGRRNPDGGSRGPQAAGNTPAEGGRREDEGGPRDGGREETDGACLRKASGCEFYTPYACSAGSVVGIIDPCAKCGPSRWEPVHRCERGCRGDYAEIVRNAGDYIPWLSPEELCEENRPKKAGDACQTRADCKPSPVTYLNGTYVPQQYLGCWDGKCAPLGPPTISRWMIEWGCGTGVVDAPSGIQVVSVPSTNCGDGLCLLADEANGCRPQTCTAPCSGDEDCPPESICGYFPDGVRACKPGYAPNDFSALKCPRGPVDGG